MDEKDKDLLIIEKIAKLLHRTQWSYFNGFLNMPLDYNGDWESLPERFKELYKRQAIIVLSEIANQDNVLDEDLKKDILLYKSKRINKIIND